MTLIYKISFLLVFFSTISMAQTIGWNKSFGGTGNEYAESVVLTSDGGFLVCGSTASSDGDITQNKGGQDAWVIKLSSTGVKEWQKTYGGSGTDGFRYGIPANDGGYILVGSSDSNNGDLTSNKGLADLWIVKVNTSGAITWQTSYGGNSADVALSICQTSNGYFIGGVSSSTNGDVVGATSNGDAWLLKINNTGTILWQKVKGGNAYDEIASVKPTSDGGCIALGSQYLDQFTTKVYLVKFESTGTIQLEKTYGGTSLDNGSDIVVAANGDYVIAGTVKSNNGDVSNNHGKKDIWVFRVNIFGNLIWQKTIGGAQDDESSAITLNSKGEIFVGGFSASSDGDVNTNKGSSDVLMAKLSPSGTPLWVKTYGSVLTNLGNAIALGNNSNLVMAATSTGSGGDVPVAAIDGARLIWVFSLDGASATRNVQDEALNFQISPNPAIEQIQVSFKVKTKGSLEICNAMGQIIEKMDIDDNNQTIDVRHYAPGTYHVILHSGQSQFVRNFVRQ